MQDYYLEQIKENADLPARVELIECPPTTFPAHWHEYIEILFLIEGSLTAVIQAKPYLLAPGELVVINPRELHMTRTSGSTAYLLLQVSWEQMNRIFSDFDSLHFQTLISPGDSGTETLPLFRTLSQMIQIYQNTQDGSQLLFMSRLYEFFYELYKDFSQRITQKDRAASFRGLQRITQIMGWVRDHYQTPITLEDAASILGISKEYFCRLFRQYTGQTFLEYVTSVRILHFYDDLLRSEDSITLLLEQNGITNYKVFMKAFKLHYGQTPQQIRKNSRRTH